MFFRKTEHKKHNFSAILIVGTLAAIGAASIVKCGKEMFGEMGNKIKSVFKKGKCMCSGEMQEN